MAKRKENAWVDELMSARIEQARAWEPGGEGRVVILVPKFDGAILGRFLMPRLREPNFRIRLDAIGTAVWELCDGSLTGQQIAEHLAERFPDTEHARERVAVFLRTLVTQRLARMLKA